MPDVVPKLSSIFFDGTNNAEVEAVVSDPGFGLVESNETRIRWQSIGESEPLYKTVYANQWLMYGYIGNGVGPVRALTQEEYVIQYREI